MKTDVRMVVEAMHDAVGRETDSAKKETLRACFRKLIAIENNSACEEIAGEFRRDGSLVVLTR